MRGVLCEENRLSTFNSQLPTSAMPSPLVFEPLFMERVWGGRRLETLLGKRLEPGVRIGESWELVDREDAQSVVHEGLLRGLTLNELWTRQRETIFGPGLADTPRFPLLFTATRCLDDRLYQSIQDILQFLGYNYHTVPGKPGLPAIRRGPRS